jgi:hypothetical protein
MASESARLVDVIHHWCPLVADGVGANQTPDDHRGDDTIEVSW